MAATAAYKQFLSSPDASLLAPKATLYYVTTGTVVSGAQDVTKHLAGLRSELKKKKEDILSSIEGAGAIAAEVETGIEFVLGGGAYLPGMDENFLTDRTVSLVIMHIVTFENDKISQIRLSWDQGALLKQLDVIGKTGRNWPIRDSREQLTTIASCLRQAAPSANANGTPNGNGARQSTGGFIHRDPHASLVLFGPRDQIEQAPNVVSPYAGTRPVQRSFTDILGDQPEGQPAAVVSPYAGQKPQQRTFEEILGDEDDDDGQGPPSPSTGRGRNKSPHKNVAPKSGSSKNFAPNRLFDGVEHKVEDDDKDTLAPQRSYRPDPTKYNHFDLSHPDDPESTPKPAPVREHGKKSKSEANWSFDDFVTPAKPQPSKAYQTRDNRHWDLEDESITQETPHYRAPPAAKPRPDADTHFDTEPATSAPLALGNITNLKDRQKAFEPHFAMSDESPAHKENAARRAAAAAAKNERGINIAGDGMGGRKGTDRNWMFGGEEPTPKKERIIIAGDGMGGRKGVDDSWRYGGEEPAPAAPKEKIIIAGDGMGGRKDADNSWRDDGDEADQQQHQGSINVTGNGMGARKGADQRWKQDDGPPESGKIAIAGDGMGGRKGTDNSWRHDGDEDPHSIGAGGSGAGLRKGTEQRWKQDDGPAPSGKIAIAGDGMGGRKDADNSWRFGGGDTSDNESAVPSGGARKANDQRWKQDDSPAPGGGKIAIAGDGMGGRKGTDRNWLYGEDDENAAPAPKKKVAPAKSGGGFNWDF